MTAIEKRIVKAAIRWWESRRPEGWGKLVHVARKSVNCSDADEVGLANVVGSYIAKYPRKSKP